MGIKLSNNAFGTLAAGINSSATSITLTSGQGARFPTLGAGDFFYATLVDTSNNLEIVKCTARSTDVLTVVRAQESTTARSYSTGDRIEIRLTAQTFLDAVNEIGPTQVSDELNTSTGYFDLPSGTTAQRPASPVGGMIRHNTTTGFIEYYDTASSSWIGIGSFQATGGTVTTSGSYTIHTFTSSGTFTVLNGVKSVEYLIVAGGGGGATDADVGGGGGGGGMITGSLSAAVQTYSVVVGAGGTGGTNSYTPGTGGGSNGSQGGNSSVFGLTAIGGGFGGTRNNNGGSGGSGGGGGDGATAGGAGTSGQGFAGGNGGGAGFNQNGGNDQGAGGGAGGAGNVWTPGPGAASSISGSSVTYAAGGRGMGSTTAAANTGNGGRGSDTTANTTGGSGIVIIRYLT